MPKSNQHLQEVNAKIVIDGNGNWLICCADQDHGAKWDEDFPDELAASLVLYRVTLHVPIPSDNAKPRSQPKLVSIEGPTPLTRLCNIAKPATE